INGLTAGTTNGISLKQIGDLVGTDTSALPDLSIRNAWFAWGIEEDTDNCIIRGVAISAELHLGAVADGSVEPGCSAGNNPIENLDTASCADSDTCLAGILMRVNPDQQEFRAEGFITGFDAGPISFDDTEISLVVSPTLQRFTLMGELVDQGAVVPNGVVTLRARHARIGTDINSVVPRCVELKPVDPHPDPPTQCPAGAIDFEGRTLLNLTSSRLIDTARVIDPGTYRVTLFSADLLHAPGYQTSQTEERWSVELLDATGTVLYSSPLISDLPNAMTFLAEQVDLEADVPAGVTTVRARHAQIGTNINSVTPCVLLERVESDNEVSTVGQQGSTTGLQ
ncbi:MAG: hypothetical protein GY939_27420, partial [Actinomycetia bacterium]|nr:hypothetical protein [Actinomycetes bacterium]